MFVRSTLCNQIILVNSNQMERVLFEKATDFYPSCWNVDPMSTYAKI